MSKEEAQTTSSFIQEPHYFESKKNLLDRRWNTFQQSWRQFREGLWRVLNSLCLFGGLVCSMGVLANIRPDGDLAFYLAPLLLLAQPIAILNPKQNPFHKILGYAFVLLFWFFFAWSIYWYFKHPTWGYRFRWMFLSFLLLAILSWNTWRRQEHTWRGVGENLLRNTWMTGVLAVTALLGYLGAKMAAQSQQAQTTSNIITVVAFLLFLALITLRFLWLDGGRRRRAIRAQENLESDYILLIEWFIPRSYAFAIIACLLLLSEATMFYTLVRTSRQTAAFSTSTSSHKDPNHSTGSHTQPKAARRMFEPRPLSTTISLTSNKRTSPTRKQRAAQFRQFLHERGTFLWIWEEHLRFSAAHDSAKFQRQQPKPQQQTSRTPLSLSNRNLLPPTKLTPKPRHHFPSNSKLQAIPTRVPPRAGSSTKPSSQHRYKTQRLLAHPQTASSLRVHAPGWWQWLWFTTPFGGYPKLQREELEKFGWFYYLSAALLSLLTAVFFTYQFRTGIRFQQYYARVLYCVRRQACGESSEYLERQQQESLADFRALLSSSNFLWRHIIFYACRAPAHSILRHFILDLRRFLLEVRNNRREWFLSQWDKPIFAISMLLVAGSSLVIVLYGQWDEHWLPWLGCWLPSLVVAALLGLPRVYKSFHPPQDARGWIWIILAVHILVSFVTFFLTLNVEIASLFWRQTLWFVKLSSIGIFPILFFGGGKRYKTHRPLPTTTSLHSDLQAQRLLLQALWKMESRPWLLRRITRYLHPVRTGSGQIGFFFSSFRNYSTQVFRRWMIDWHNGMQRPAYLWLGALGRVCLFLFVMTWHLLVYHRMFPEHIARFYLVSISLIGLPGTLSWLVWYFWKRSKPSPSTPHSEKAPSNPQEDESPDSPNQRMPSQTLGDPEYRESWKELNKTTRQRMNAVLVATAFLSWMAWIVLLNFSILDSLLWGFPALFACFPGLHFALNRIPLTAWKERLQEKQQNYQPQKNEEEFLTNIYKSAATSPTLEPETRDLLMEGCAEILEVAFASLQTGHWEQEEQHALQRVHRQWIQNRSLHKDPSAQTAQNHSQELAQLAERSLDILGSLLYDTHTTHHQERRDYLLRIITRPSVGLPRTHKLLSTLERILRLPLPTESMLPNKYVESTVRDSLPRVLQELAHLLVFLYEQWLSKVARLASEGDSSSATTHLDYGAQALRMLALLDRFFTQEQQPHTTIELPSVQEGQPKIYMRHLFCIRHKLLDMYLPHESHPLLRQRAEKDFWKAASFCKELSQHYFRKTSTYRLPHATFVETALHLGFCRWELPTPLAILHEHMEEARLLSQMDSLSPLPHKRKHRKVLRTNYKGLRAPLHLSSSAREIRSTTLQQAKASNQKLEWYRQAIVRMLEGVALYLWSSGQPSDHRKDLDLLHNPKAHENFGLIQALVEPLLAQLERPHHEQVHPYTSWPERNYQSYRSLLTAWYSAITQHKAAIRSACSHQELEEIWFTLFAPILRKHKQGCPPLYWFFPHPGTSNKGQSFHHLVMLKGWQPTLSPSIDTRMDGPLHTQKRSSPVAFGVSLGQTLFLRTQQTPSLPYPHAIWSLQLLRELVFSAALLPLNNEQFLGQEHFNKVREARAQRLQSFLRVFHLFTTQLGEYPPEEEAILQQRLHNIGERWEVVLQGLGGIQGEQAVDFGHTLQQLEQYLLAQKEDTEQSLFNACWLNMLPSSHFSVLLHRETCDDLCSTPQEVHNYAPYREPTPQGHVLWYKDLLSEELFLTYDSHSPPSSKRETQPAHQPGRLTETQPHPIESMQ